MITKNLTWAAKGVEETASSISPIVHLSDHHSQNKRDHELHSVFG